MTNPKSKFHSSRQRPLKRTFWLSGAASIRLCHVLVELGMTNPQSKFHSSRQRPLKLLCISKSSLAPLPHAHPPELKGHRCPARGSCQCRHPEIHPVDPKPSQDIFRLTGHLLSPLGFSL